MIHVNSFPWCDFVICEAELDNSKLPSRDHVLTNNGGTYDPGLYMHGQIGTYSKVIGCREN